MRWEYTQPIYEVADRQVNITPHRRSCCTPARTATAARCTTRTTSSSSRASASPGTGRIKNKFVFRGGYAISSFLEGTGANLRLPLNPPFFFEANVNYDLRTPGDIRIGFADVIRRRPHRSPHRLRPRTIRAAPGISTCARSSPSSSTCRSSTSSNATSSTVGVRRQAART